MLYLIRPPAVLPISSFQSQSGCPPLGLAYLSGALENENIEHDCIDSVGLGLGAYFQDEFPEIIVQGLSSNEIMDRIDTPPTVFALSCMFANEWIYIKKIVKDLYTKYPSVPIILGGEFSSAEFKYLLENYPEITACCIGEGEETLVELIKSIQENVELKRIPGIAFKMNGTVIQTEGRKRIKEIDKIPWPNWSKIPLDDYLDKGLGDNIFNKRAIPVLASRGCPYQCTFCSSPQMWTTLWKSRAVDNVLDEIKYYIDRYNVDHIQFYDLTMIINKKWIQLFCSKLIEENLNITWSLPSGTRTEALDENVLRLLKASGCEAIALSPESGSEKTLKLMKKRLKLNDMFRVMRLCHKVGIRTKVNIIFGLPEQDHAQCWDNLKFIARSALAGVDDQVSLRFVPYPGSELFIKLKKEMQLPTQNIEEYEKWLALNINNDISAVHSWSEHISSNQLKLYLVGSMIMFYSLSFLIRPIRILKTLKNVFSGKPKSTFDFIILSIYQKLKITLWKNPLS